jgi:hypothetical protein
VRGAIRESCHNRATWRTLKRKRNDEASNSWSHKEEGTKSTPFAASTGEGGRGKWMVTAEMATESSDFTRPLMVDLGRRHYKQSWLGPTRKTKPARSSVPGMFLHRVRGAIRESCHNRATWRTLKRKPKSSPLRNKTWYASSPY